MKTKKFNRKFTIPFCFVKFKIGSDFKEAKNEMN